MKKLGWFGCSLIIYLFSSNVSADNNQDRREKLFCPQEISCSVAGEQGSCKVVDKHSEYWDAPFSAEGRVVMGVYNLKEVISSYQLHPSLWHGGALCKYNNLDGNVERYISTRKILPNLFEPFLGSATQWRIAGYNAECFSDSPKSCPLVEEAELAVIAQGENKHNISYDLRIKGSITGGRTTMHYDNALAACGNIHSCEIQILASSGVPGGCAGTITVDLTKDNVIEIVKMVPSQSKIKISKQAPFNTVGVELLR